MRKYYISEIDLEVNEGRSICLDVAMKRVQRHIAETIDLTFPAKEFTDWCDSDTEKPFKWGSALYYWDR